MRSRDGSYQLRQVPWSELCAFAADDKLANRSRENAAEIRRMKSASDKRVSGDIGAPEQGGGQEMAPGIGSIMRAEGLNSKAGRSGCGRAALASSILKRAALSAKLQA